VSVCTFSAKAATDLGEIRSYLMERNPTAAVRIISQIIQHCQLLADNPRIGWPHPDMQRRLRMLPVENYLILHRPIRAGIHVVRIVDGRRDLRHLGLRRKA
jgi:plasmid stabilization system protein ParE